jgi:formylglycine-generating enzyme required for sulfatase activity
VFVTPPVSFEPVTPAEHPAVGGGSAEDTLWRQMSACGTVTCYAAYKEAYPNGRYVAAAEALMASLSAATVPPVPAAQQAPSELESDLGLSRDERRGVQVALNALGFSVGGADGLWGSRTRSGIERWQTGQGLASTGYLDAAGYKALLAEAEPVLAEQRRAEQRRAAEEARRRVPLPEMVSIRGGGYSMGSPEDEEGRDADERRHWVSVDDFKLAKHEVTVGEFGRFVEATGYRTDAEKNAGGREGCWAFEQGAWDWRAWANWRKPNKYQVSRDEDPVSCVSWNDAVAYVEWLSRESGQRFRLPTEAEWEFAARAGTQTARSWGDDPSEACDYANVADRTRVPPGNYRWDTKHECTDSAAFVAAVGSYRANAYGLYDMLGNVWEWTCSAYDEGYGGAEQRCVSKNDASRRVNRGGSWNNKPRNVRSANRNRNTPDNRNNNLGFRLAQSTRTFPEPPRRMIRWA